MFLFYGYHFSASPQEVSYMRKGELCKKILIAIKNLLQKRTNTECNSPGLCSIIGRLEEFLQHQHGAVAYV